MKVAILHSTAGRLDIEELEINDNFDDLEKGNVARCLVVFN